MVRILFILIFSSFTTFANGESLSKGEKKRIQVEAKNLGKNSINDVFKSLEGFCLSDDLLPEKDKGKEFDGKKAKEDVLTGKVKSNPVVEFLEENSIVNSYLSENEMLFSDELNEVGSEEGEYLEVCKESADPVTFHFTRTLNYDLEKELEKVMVLKCLGHNESRKVTRGKGESKAKKKSKTFESDQNIKWFKVKNYKKGSDHHDVVESNWRHVDDCLSCSHNEKVVEFRETGSWRIINEKWEYSNSSIKKIAYDSKSRLVSKKCLDNVARDINGTKLSQCWVERFEFIYTPEKVSGCDFLKSQFCKLKLSECLKNGPFGCDLWKRTFSCYKALNRKKQYELDSEDLGLADFIVEGVYEPNESLSDVTTKLQIFNEMDKDLQNTDMIDTQNFEFFSGKKHRCYVNFLGDLVYDCCNKMGGLAVDAVMSKCDEEELALLDLNNRGQCHYVGKKNHSELGVKVSKKKIFCCFSSKLARIFVEEAKDQLGLTWGTAEKPDCGGLSQSQIQEVDFDKINLSSAFEVPAADFNERINRLQQKISDGLKQGEKN